MIGLLCGNIVHKRLVLSAYNSNSVLLAWARRALYPEKVTYICVQSVLGFMSQWPMYVIAKSFKPKSWFKHSTFLFLLPFGSWVLSLLFCVGLDLMTLRTIYTTNVHLLINTRSLLLVVHTLGL